MMCFMIKHNYVGNLDFYWYVCVCTLGNQIQYATFKFHNNNVSGIKVLKSSAFPNGARSTSHSHACQDVFTLTLSLNTQFIVAFFTATLGALLRGLVYSSLNTLTTIVFYISSLFSPFILILLMPLTKTFQDVKNPSSLGNNLRHNQTFMVLCSLQLILSYRASLIRQTFPISPLPSVRD